MAPRRPVEAESNFWTVPAYLPYVQPPLTDRAIKAAELLLGVRLPRSYLDLLRTQNGGYIRKREHPSGHVSVSDIAGIGPRYPSILRRDWTAVKEHMAENGLTTPKRIDDLVPFQGDGHVYYCLDYRRSGPKKEPRVTYIDVECFNVDEVLAPNFATFLGQLTAEPEPVLGVVTDAPIAVVASEFAKAAGLKFEDQGAFDHGVATYRAKVGAGWLFLTPNRVARGFLRDGETCHRTARRLLKGEAYRLPGSPDVGYFLGGSVDSKVAKAALRKLPFVVKRVSL